jgi:hypothetical protein
VTTPTFPRRRVERFAQLLDEANGGPRHHVRSRLDSQLSELVVVGRRVGALGPTVRVDTGFRTDLRAVLVAAAERDGIAAVHPDRPAPTHGPDPHPAGRAATGLLGNRRLRARAAVLTGLTAAVAVSGMSAASENAVPGDALYGMKRSTERAQLALAASDVSRGQLYLDFARTRLSEAAAVRGDALGFAVVLDDMDYDTRQASRLLTTAAVRRSDPAALDTVTAFLTTHRRQVARLLDGAGAAQRERATASLTLLDQIGGRSDGLRAGLACGVEQSIRADALGPLPRACTPRPAPSTGRSDGPAPQPQTPSRPSGRTPERPGQPTAAPTPSPNAMNTPPTGRTSAQPPQPALPGR